MAKTVYIKCIKDSVYTPGSFRAGKIAFYAGKVYEGRPVGNRGYPDQYQMTAEDGMVHEMLGELGSEYFQLANQNDPSDAWDRAMRGL